MTAIVRSQTPIQPEPADAGAGEQYLLLYGISWPQYIAISDALGERGGLRIVYDRGRLEFMTTSPLHERYKVWFGRFFDVLAEEAGVANVPAGQATFRRENIDRGMEPDNCYWIAHEQQMRGVREWQADRDPPPDLALEIEISRTIDSRLEVLAAIAVPEIWSFDSTAIRIRVLRGDHYQFVERSPLFPNVDLTGMVAFFRKTETQDSLTVLREFRAWVRQQLAKK